MTKQKLDDAVTAHVQDLVDGGIVTAWIGIAVVVTASEVGQSTRYVRVASSQPIHSSIGLARYLEQSLQDTRRMSAQ